MTIKIKRVYDPPASDDGYRILVDRLWPRGLTSEAAKIDLWMKGIAPTDELRKWFGHDPERWTEFHERYEKELADHEDLLDLIHDTEQHWERVTLLFGAKDEAHNQAVVLADVLKERSATHRR